MNENNFIVSVANVSMGALNIDFTAINNIEHSIINVLQIVIGLIGLYKITKQKNNKK